MSTSSQIYTSTLPLEGSSIGVNTMAPPIPAQNIPGLIALAIYTILPITYWTTEYHASRTPYYSYRNDFTSNLGIPYAGVDKFTNERIFSARAHLMNMNFIFNGLHFLVAGICFGAATSKTFNNKFKAARVIVAGLYCVGIILVAAVPGGPKERQNGTAIWHLLGALLAIAGGNVNSLVTGMAVPADRMVYKCACLLLGLFGLLSFGIFLGRQAPEGKDNGLWQRAAIYPTTIWEICTAVFLVREMSREPESKKSQ